MSFGSREFREALGLFASGVTIISADMEESVHAMTANAVSSVSLDPPLVLFCPAKKAKLSFCLPKLSGFTINVLRQEQQALASYFAGAWRESPAPPFRFIRSQHAPRLEGSAASIVCRIERIIEAGDHWVVLGRALELHRGVEPCQPLLFYRGRFRDIDLEEEGTVAPDLVGVAEEPPHIFYH